MANEVRNAAAQREAAFKLRAALGRPPLDPEHETVRCSVRLSRPDWERVRAIADALGVSWSAAFRQLVRGAAGRERRGAE